MEGRRTATVHDKGNKLEIEVWVSNKWFFARWRYETKGKWRNASKPYKHALSAIRGAYYEGTGKL